MKRTTLDEYKKPDRFLKELHAHMFKSEHLDHHACVSCVKPFSIGNATKDEDWVNMNE